MAAPGRLLPRLRPFVARGPAVRFVSTHTIQSQTPPSPIVPSQKQAQPIGNFYQSMLDDPLPSSAVKTEKPPTTAAAAPKKEPAAKKGPTEQEEPPAPNPPLSEGAQKAAIVFGAALAGNQSRRERLAAARQNQYTIVAGVRVPPLPEEPDNCCMSGCVNCVWETYREEMEEWQAATAEAKAASARRDAKERVDVSMDDDGGGSDTNWVPETPPTTVAKDLWDDKLYKDIPVGIRAFMQTEKKLKAVHEREGTTGG